jgi:hypothetical protein
MNLIRMPRFVKFLAVGKKGKGTIHEPEVRGQKPEVRSQKSEVGGQQFKVPSSKLGQVMG